MKQIKLNRLEIQNFRSQNIVADFSDITKISGKNGVGKSTIMKAWLWLWSSYTDAYAVRNNALFDEKTELSPDTPKASVKAYISVDGNEYTIERTAEANFLRKRGTDEYVKANSDTYTLYLDNVEIKNSDFENWVNENICPIEMLVYVLDGSFFATLLDKDKDKARKLLEKVIGKVSEEDMKGDYSSIKEDLCKYSIEQIEERTKKEIKPIKDRLKEIPAVIDKQEQTIASMDTTDFGAILTNIDKKKHEIEDIDNRILGVSESLKPIIGQRDHIFDIINSKTIEMNNAKSKYITSFNSRINAIKSELQTCNQYNLDGIKSENKKKADIDFYGTRINEYEKLIAGFNLKLDNLRKERDAIKEKVFTEDKCSFCGQVLPQEMLEEAKQKFNVSKKEQLEDIIATGKYYKQEVERCEKEIANFKSLIKDIQNSEVFIPKDLTALRNSLDDIQASFVPYEDTDEYKSFVNEIENLKQSLPELPDNDSELLRGRKRELINDLEYLNRQYGIKDKIDSMRDEILALKEEAKTLSINLALLEGKLDKCGQYRQEKSDIISFRINGKLEGCCLEMWSAQKDGTIVPDVVLKGKDGVRYSALNFSDRIKTCLEMQKLFMRSNEVSIPIWVDESSCFSDDNLPTNPDGQIIYIFADNNDFLTIK